MNVIGFDDAPFERAHRGDLPLVGAVCARTRLDGLLIGRVRRHGANATERMADLVARSRFRDGVRAVLLQGIAVGGFNVVDIHALARALGLPVVVVARRRPDLEAMRAFLAREVPGWRRKWALVEKAGPMEPVRGLWIQRAGPSLAQAERLLEATTLHGKLPEPLRLAHLVAGALVTGASHGRA